MWAWGRRGRTTNAARGSCGKCWRRSRSLLKPDEPGLNNEELKSLFQTMRAADAERAPSFSQTYRTMPYRDRLGYLRAITVAAVAVLILAVIGVNALRHGAGESPASTRPLAKAASESSSSNAGVPTRASAGV